MNIFSYTKDEYEYCLGILNLLKKGIKEQRSFPMMIELQTFNRCNAKCPVCPYPYTTAKEEMMKIDDSLYHSLLKQMADENDFMILVLSFQNEPLVDSSLIEKAKMFKELMPKKQLHMVTNGSLLSKELGEKVYRYFDLVSISVNAHDKKTYEEVMGGIKFESISNNLNYISSKPEWINKTILRFIRQRANFMEHNDFKKHWNKKGFRVFGFEINSRLGNVRDYENLRISDNLLRKADKAFMKAISRFILSSCPIPSMTFYIRVNGDVVLCFNDWSKNHIIGNVAGKSIREIFNSEFYSCAKSNAKSGMLPNENICNKCDLFKEKIFLTI